MKLNVIYRISNGSYDKDRIATKETCLSNFVGTCLWNDVDKFYVLMDNCNADTQRMILRNAPRGADIREIQGGSSAQSFNRALDFALTFNDDEYVYFVEDDYLHWMESRKVLEEGLQRAHYLSLYDHPDKYIDSVAAGNPYVDDGGEITRVFRTPMCHWKLTNSTTMTFATRVGILRADESIWRKYTEGTYPRDFDAFIALRNMGRTLATPIPGYSTHVERNWLTPYRDWSTL